MAFTSTIGIKVDSLPAGEVLDSLKSATLTATDFEAGLADGVFVKQEGSTLSAMDGSATPVIAGVTVRSVSDAFTDSLSASEVENIKRYLVEGYVSVVAKANETAPDRHAPVYASNAGDADDGKATATNTDAATSAKFLYVIKAATAAEDGVWAVQVK